MLTVTCRHCHTKLKAKDELAGRNVRCPRCKTVVGIPEAPSDDTTLPPHPGAAVSEEVTASSTAAAQPHDESLATSGHLRIQCEIARGGMGAIMRAVDEDIQREVAVKFLLNAADSRQKARFVIEAQITGQLEHPNIVPIHQLGVHADGRCFFSMKMVKGHSLGEILKDNESTYTLSRLLTVFVSICNAMAYAHSRQVIHRDLKPANIMVGDFGEVYVMDWGLAKVLGTPEPPSSPTDIRHSDAAETTPSQTDSGSKSGDRVATKRLSAGDLTQAGAIMGTPAYMPPEQASGHEVDERADIYSLGAILYEIMTRTPPVGKGGDMMAVLMRVLDGKIESPEVRSPERARDGWTPPELAAVAMKALSAQPTDRYLSVADLQRDIQRFQEGRSVSAKQDSVWEIVRKLVRRNRGASIAMAVSLVVLLAVAGYFLKVNYDANAAYRAEQQEKEKRTREAVPALIQAARLNIDRLALDQAAAQIDLGLVYAPADAEARLLKAQLLIARKQFAEGVRELDLYRKDNPEDAESKLLREYCTASDSQESSNMMKITSLFVRQKVPGLAEMVLREYGPSLPEARKRLLEMYRARIEKGLPGVGQRLSIDNSGLFILRTKFNDEIATLEPLRGIPISSMECETASSGGSKFTASDLSPLKGMPLTSLRILSAKQISDLSPLQGMQLRNLAIGYSALSDLSPLHGMPLATLQLNNCASVTDLSPLRGMPLTSLEVTGFPRSSLTDLTALAGMKLTFIGLGHNSNVLVNANSVKTLREMSSLKTINLRGVSYTADDFWRRFDSGELKK